MTTAWERLTILSNNTVGTALIKFNAITNNGTGTVISNGYSFEYSAPIYLIDLRQHDIVELTTNNIDTSVSSSKETVELNVSNLDLLVNSNDTINIEVN